jgi:putative tryptophan/tyrosine transport system substrate-binding protein
MRRREFLGVLGSMAAAFPVTARAQQPTMPVIGFLHPTSPETNADRLRAFRQGLKDVGFVEGDSVVIEYRWAENQIDRLPALAEDLVRRKVAVIATFAGGALAAKAATTTIPIVFLAAADPVRLGLIASLARPSGNLTGVNLFSGELTAKRLELLRELVPTATRVAMLVSPTLSEAPTTTSDMEAAARAMGLKSQIFSTDTSREINAAFTTFLRDRPDALVVGPGPFFLSRRVQIVHLATRHAIPATFPNREHTDVGGLMSYGPNVTDAFRQIGVYVGRVLKGEKPADMPVVQSSKFELVINAETARTLGITVPASLLARADEVIE